MLPLNNIGELFTAIRQSSSKTVLYENDYTIVQDSKKNHTNASFRRRYKNNNLESARGSFINIIPILPTKF